MNFKHGKIGETELVDNLVVLGQTGFIEGKAEEHA